MDLVASSISPTRRRTDDAELEQFFMEKFHEWNLPPSTTPYSFIQMLLNRSSRETSPPLETLLFPCSIQLERRRNPLYSSAVPSKQPGLLLTRICNVDSGVHLCGLDCGVSLTSQARKVVDLHNTLLAGNPEVQGENGSRLKTLPGTTGVGQSGPIENGLLPASTI